MSIPETRVGDKSLSKPDWSAAGAFRSIFSDWVLVAIILLTASLCFGIGLIAGKEDQAHVGKDDSLWVEQLPKEELPGSPGASSSSTISVPSVSSQASTKAATPDPSSSQSVSKNTEDSSQPAAAVAAFPVAAPETPHNYVASKTGTKYYLPSCATAKRIKEENKVWFATREAAASAGYAPAANCKGL